MFEDTLKSMGVDPEKIKAEEIKKSPEELENLKTEKYRDIGEARAEAAKARVQSLGNKISGFASGSWNKIKSFGSKTVETGVTAGYVALAAPEMVKDANEAINKGVREVGVTIGENLAEGAAYVSTKAKGAYESAINTTTKKFEDLKSRGEAAKDKFMEKLTAAKQARQERIHKAQIESATKEIAKRLAELNEARERLNAALARKEELVKQAI